MKLRKNQTMHACARCVRTSFARELLFAEQDHHREPPDQVTMRFRRRNS